MKWLLIVLAFVTACGKDSPPAPPEKPDPATSFEFRISNVWVRGTKSANPEKDRARAEAAVLLSK